MKKFFNWFRSGAPSRVKILIRSALIKAGEISRLTVDWNPTTATHDALLVNKIVTIRNRARTMEIDNDYIKKFLAVRENNIVGHAGFSLTVAARTIGKGSELDARANSLVWEAFQDWGKRANCTVTGEDSWVDVQLMAMRAEDRDGGILVRKRIGRRFGKYGFQLQLLEVDHLDVNYTGTSERGNRVVSGIERDEFGKVVFYHLFDRHPGDIIGGQNINRYKRTAVPASEIIHLFNRTRPSQSFGVPSVTSAMTRIHHVGEYEYSEAIAARAGASKGGWFESERGGKFQGETEYDSDGNPSTLNDFEPGSFDELPAGTKFVPYDPKHPTDAFPNFIKASLLGASAGLDVGYSTLTGDLSSANYSSMRSGKLDEWESFKRVQRHFAEHLLEPIFAAWLEVQLLNRSLGYGVDEFDRLNKPVFRGRRWPWVDPEKDIKAQILAIENGLNSRTRIADEQGLDLEEIFEELASEKALAEKYDLELGEEKEPQQMEQEDEKEQEPEAD